MSCVLVTFAIENAAVDPLGAKEALVMAVEHLGDVQVLRVDAREPEQLSIGGKAPEQGTAPAASPHRPAPVPSGRQANAAPSRLESRGLRPSRVNMACCLNCEFYRKESGLDEAGKFRWGVCRLTGRSVRELRDQCGSWTQEK